MRLWRGADRKTCAGEVARYLGNDRAGQPRQCERGAMLEERLRGRHNHSSYVDHPPLGQDWCTATGTISITNVKNTCNSLSTLITNCLSWIS